MGYPGLKNSELKKRDAKITALVANLDYLPIGLFPQLWESYFKPIEAHFERTPHGVRA